MDTLHGKVVVVTGATGGIGRALVRALAEHGCRLGLLARTPEKLAKLAVELRGTVLSAQPVDVRDRAAVADAVAAVERTLGPVDVLIHNAGVGRLTDARSPNLDDLIEMLGVNYLGGVYVLAAVLPSMLARGGGQIVAVSSLGARRALPWCAGYAASKVAFATYLESLRPALRRRGIRVTTVYPGFVRTAMSEVLPLRFPMPMMRPEAAARRIIRAISKGRREAAFPWYQAAVMSVLRRLPAWAYDHLMAAAGRWGIRGDY
ncbi:MAG TPA: SDR family NAD(P)-dependent oxidoreductase [Gemmataceae bacterium]|nr:SDR family NAD(P)-dependent oxidoreductase [Gemmataceae bacterium]